MIGAHLSEQQLNDWLRNQLDPQDERLVEQHLEVCDRCAQKLECLPLETDPFLDVLRQNKLSSLETSATSLQTESNPAERSVTIFGSGLDEEGSRWQRELLLATGGIGEVWVTVDRLLENTVALKCLRKETANFPSIQKRFLHEARLTAQINHPGIPRVLDLVDAGPDSYYVMSLVRGRTLTSLIQSTHQTMLREEQPVYSSALSRLVHHWIAVARTIEAAHSRKILHRDLKSENVIVGDHGQVTVIDWGLAKKMNRAQEETDPLFDTLLPANSNPSSTRPGTRLGTPSFMSPEQASGRIEDLDERTDVWGLGAMLYEILTGRPPFTGKNNEDIFNEILQRDPLPPHFAMPLVPEQLSILCMKALRKNPVHRYQSASDFANAIEDWIASESTHRQFDLGRQKLFDLSDDLMFVFNADSRILWGNAAFERQLGWTPEEKRGEDSQCLTHPDDHVTIEQKLALRNGITLQHEARLIDKQGKYHWFSWTITPVLDEAVFYAVGRNIEDRIRRENEYLLLLNSAPDATVVINEDYSIHMVNNQLLDMFGYQQEELIGKPVTTLWPERVRTTYLGQFQILLDSQIEKPRDGQHRFHGRHKSGKRFRLFIRLSMVDTSQTRQCIASIRYEDTPESDKNPE
ncbi:MAG: PAS domain S-box protein [Planctomycetaceae bacterium]|nr:PAS domain S-box protein [Planctomycetaceae bacterium]